jgi:N-acyl-phosphatidylethanolamine-hydrolysing phospholipase D
MTSAKDKKPLPAHHDPKGNGFVNPWPSFTRHGHLALIRMLFGFDRKQAAVTPTTQLPKILNINKDLINTFSRPQERQGTSTGPGQITATWLGQYVDFLFALLYFHCKFQPRDRNSGE